MYTYYYLAGLVGFVFLSQGIEATYGKGPAQTIIGLAIIFGAIFLAMVTYLNKRM